MDQKQYWNDVAPTKRFTTPFQSEAFAEYVAKDMCVLDIGCGYGRTLAELRWNGYESLMGMDISEEMIARGRREHAELDLRVMERGRIDLPNDSVDAVILFAVLTCIPEDVAQRVLLDEIRRVLRPGGILYVNDFLLNTDARNVSRYKRFCEKYGAYGVFELPEGAVCRHHSEAHIRELLSGFHMLQYAPLTFTTMNGHVSNGFCFIGEMA